MMQPQIGLNDWVLVCETGERGQVIEIFDEGERFLLTIPKTEQCPYARKVHVMIEKIRKIRPPKIKESKFYWEQTDLF